MKLDTDIAELVRSARAHGRAALTVSLYQRLNLFYDPCKGWFLTSMPMPDHSGALSRKLDESRDLQIDLAASLVQEAIRATGEAGGFGQRCVLITDGGEVYVFRWAFQPPRPAGPES